MRKGSSLRQRMIWLTVGVPLLWLIPVLFFVGRAYRAGAQASVWRPGDLVTFVIAGLVTVVGVIVVTRIALNRLVIVPLNTLAEGAAIVGAGDLAHKIRIERDDEFGFVAETFNQMAEQLSTLVSRLEEDVTVRTAALARRNAQLEAVSLVGQEAARERNVSTLLDVAVTAISDNFGFYHTGIFILDDGREWAILRAASSEGGKQLLARGHRLRVGQVGIVGYVAATGKPRVASSVGQDAVWFPTPDLPLTQSEVGLPLVSESEVIGVLDVQSEVAAAFADEDVRILQLMADQLAVALMNARALETMESALAELRELQVNYGQRGWARVTQRLRPLAYEYDRVETTPVSPLPVPADLVSGDVSHKMVMDGGVPVVMEALRVGDQVLGYLGLADSRRAWSDEELALVRSVGEQVALALDNARLFEDTQRNERQQYLISQVLQAASSPELSSQEVLQEIARILAQGLDMAVVIFTFPYPTLPIVSAHALVDAEGQEMGPLAQEVRLSQADMVFFQGLGEPELGPMAPLLEQGAADEPADGTKLSGYDLDRVLYVPIARVGAATATAGEVTSRGFIGLIQSREAPPVDPDTRDLAQNLASQIAVVLENLDLSEETQRRSEELRQLYRISLVLSEMLAPTDVLEAIVSQGARLLEADAANLWVYEDELETLRLALDHQGGAEGRLDEGQPVMRLRSGEGLAGESLIQQRTIVVEDYSAWGERVSQLVSSRFRSMLAIPLVGRLSPLGVLVVLSEQIGFFGEREASLADLFSAQAATALENARLNQEAQRRAEEFSQLYEAGLDLITILDLEPLLSRAAAWARQVFGAERAVVFLRESGAADSTQPFVRGQSVSESRYLPDEKADRPSPGGLTERIIEGRESLLIRDNRAELTESARRLVEAGLLSQMGTPLRVGTEVLGAIFVNGSRVDQFSEQDVTLLEFLATQVSSALQNSIQFGETERALAVVGQQARYQANVSQAVALLNERGAEAAPEVLRLLGQAAEVSMALYFRLDGAAQTGTAPDESRLSNGAWRIAGSWMNDGADAAGRADKGMRDEQLRKWATGLSTFLSESLQRQGSVMITREDLADRTQDTRTQAVPFGAILALAVPEETAAPGFIGLFRDVETLWSDQEVVALQMAAAALSNALAREHLFEQVQETLSETEALYRGGAALSEASTYDGILEVLLTHTILGQGGSTATLHLLDRVWTGEQLPTYSEVVAYRVPDGDSVTETSFGRLDVRKFPAAFAVMRDGTPVFVEDLSRDTTLDRRVHALFGRMRGASSLVIMPLLVGGQRIGYLHADYRTPQRFPEAARRRLISLTQQAAIAVLNIRQLRETEARVRREQLIRQITSNIQEATDVPGVLQTAVRELGRAFGTSRNRVQFRPPSPETGVEDGGPTAETEGDGAV